jgi:hypothetical protein
MEERAFALFLVCENGYVDLGDVVRALMPANKVLRAALSRLTAVYAWARRGGRGGFVEGLLSTFSGMKLLHINAEALVPSDLARIFGATHITLLRLLNVGGRHPMHPTHRLGCAHLTQLAVSGSTWLVVHVVDVHRLQALAVTDNMHVTSAVAARLVGATQALTSLRLANLPALRQVPVHAGLLKSLQTLSVTHCRFVDRIEAPGTWAALLTCDVSCTALPADAVAALVATSPRLVRLDARALLSLRGTLTLRSASLRCVDLQLCTNLGALVLTCPALEAADVRGCFSLRSLRVASVCPLAHLDLAMLTRLADLDVADHCPALRHLDLAGCAALPSRHWAHPAVPPTSMTDHALAEIGDDDADADADGDESLSNAVGTLTLRASPSSAPSTRSLSAVKHVANRRNKSRRSASV